MIGAGNVEFPDKRNICPRYDGHRDKPGEYAGKVGPVNGIGLGGYAHKPNGAYLRGHDADARGPVWDILASQQEI